MNALKLTRKQAQPVLAATFPEYAGRRIRLVFAESLTLHNLTWSGGSRNEYRFVKGTGEAARLPANLSPWEAADSGLEGASIRISPNVMAVERSFYCGADMGVRIIAHPCYAPKWIE